MSSAITTPAVTNGSSSAGRSGRLPRWTRQEILILIEGKRSVERRAVEPKWSAVSDYCRRHGVERGPLQCRKRWSNLACEFKKIKAWEGREKREREKEEECSYWEMRSDLRRERRLPGCFDREVYELIMEGEVEEKEVEVVVFDSGRKSVEVGLFSDSEREEDDEEEEEEETVAAAAVAVPVLVGVMPISEKKYQPVENENSDPGNLNDKQQTDNNPEKGSSSWEGQKRRRTSEEGGGEEISLENKLIEVLERNSRMLSAQLEAQNLNCQLDRDQRKDQADGLLGILTKLADSLGRIADKI